MVVFGKMPLFQSQHHVILALSPLTGMKSSHRPAHFLGLRLCLDAQRCEETKRTQQFSFSHVSFHSSSLS